MSAWWQFRALIRKNLLTLKRSIFMTLMEIFYPIILMLIGYLVKHNAFSSQKFTWEGEGKMTDYLIDKGNFNLNYETYSSILQNPTSISSYTNAGSGKWKYIDPLGKVHPTDMTTFYGLPLKPLTTICYNRFTIAFVGFTEGSPLGVIIKGFITAEGTKLNRPYKIKYFKDVEELNNYVTSDDYGQANKPTICFGVSFKEREANKYSASLHYFNDFITHGIEDVPNNLKPPNEEMQQGPNMNDIIKYSNNGYIQMLNILANYALKKKESGGYINYGFAVQKYDSYRYNAFASFAGLYFTFFIILAYLCPLILYVLKMVVEKESRSKEVMKIMGMGEGTYFMSYFVEFFVINIIYAFALGYIASLMFYQIPFLYLVLYLWLFGLNVFALAFFCQSFMDTTRLALIVSCLIYCLMLFVSAAVYDDKIKKLYKTIAALLPPVNLLLGAFTLGKFEGMFYPFYWKDVKENYLNYSMATCYIMFAADFFIYLFLGYYFQNVIPHEYGVPKPWYFIFLPSYWCGDCCCKRKKNNNTNNQKTDGKNNNENIYGKIQTLELKENGPNNAGLVSQNLSYLSNASSIFDDNPNEGNTDFQNEDLYRDKDKKNDVFMLRKVTKVYGDGKMACNNISFNLFRNEIFALLGRNGAGKTSLINVLIGMYDATSGQAIYKENNILDESQMKEFRNKLGICPQHDILFPQLTVREHLEMFCYFKGFDVDKIKEEVDNTLKDFRIHDIENILAGTLSAGQRRKLSIAISVIGGSEVIFLDEPSSGMDITSRRNLWEILKKIIEKRIIILTTHYMEEASVLGNRIGIMAEGVLKCIGTPLFLIEKYGKYLSINIYKEKDADNDKIINFFKSKAEGIDTEILTQEILIRIPKNKPGTNQKNIDIQTFFSELDNNTNSLRIKSYSASMPTLEDVFLNVGSVRMEEEEILKSGKIDEAENERILFKQKYIKDFSKMGKFCYDSGILLKKRGLQIIRDTKTFMLEILCPILLVIVGCLVVQIDIFEDSKPIHLDSAFLSEFGDQVIYYGAYHQNPVTNDADDIAFFNNFKINQINVTSEFLSNENKNFDTSKDGLINFIEKKLYEKENDKNTKNNYGALYNLSPNSPAHQYNLVQVVNGRARQSPMLYAYVFLNKVLKNEGIEFDFTHYPLPTTKDNKSNSKAINNFCLVFFVSIAFSLIPANFVSSIVSERINNSKHLMRISGVSIFAYWLINFFFELIKYYFTSSICFLLLWLFKFVPDYFYILYLCYGPSMIAITYFFSFLFDSEAAAQNFLIIFNLVIGSLGSTVVIMLRSMKRSTKIAKLVAYFFRIVPSFAFGYGYNLLLNGKLILFIDYSIEYLNKPNSIKISFEYAGSDAVFLGGAFIVYMIIMSIFEIYAYSFREVDDGLIQQNENKKLDENVKKEIEKVNQEKIIIEKKEEPKKKIVKKIVKKNQGNIDNGINTEKFILNDNINNVNTENQVNGNTPNNLINAQVKKKKKKKKKKKIKIKVKKKIKKKIQNNVEGNYKNININDFAVKIKNCQKIYNNTCCSKPTIGIKNISFTVEYGECFGLLGLNGAGKTTIFKSITEEHAPTHGSIYVNGQNILKNFDEVKLMFGYCPQFDAIFPYMTVYENLEFYSKIKGVDPDKLKSIIKAMIESMTLSKYRDKQAGRLSGGNKRKLSVAISMICNPPIVLLDEPSTGMDPEARRFMWAVIHKLTSKSNSNCVIMTTHAMDEAETLCRRMGIMVNGEFVCMGSANYIKENYGYGFEIDVRIKPFEQKKLYQIIESLGLKRNYKISSIDEAKDILTKINKNSFCSHLNENDIGRKIYHEIMQSGNTSIQTLINWSRYVSCAMKMISVVLPHFSEVILAEFIENNFLFKIKKSKNSKSIGFLFTLLETQKEPCEITEYSIQQTSLEQIFNKFAKNQGKTEEDILNEKEINNDILINSSLVNDLSHY